MGEGGAMDVVMGHQWEDLYRVPRAADVTASSGGRSVGATHLCCECAYSTPLRFETRCRCTHPSAEYADGALFAGEPACAAFTPGHYAQAAFRNGSGGTAVLHGN
jgi:hypothetical protein